MKNIIGQKFNRLTAIKFAERRDRDYYWLFKCDCDNELIIRINNVKSGHTKSCGCYHKEYAKEQIVKLNTTHGLAHSSFYHIWCTMRARCGNSKYKLYKDYGGRGIKVDKRWNRFENFRDDMYKSYLEHIKVFGKKNTSIDRIDNNGNYFFKNCRWATRREQARNARFNHNIIYNGISHCISEWAEIYNMSPKILGQRIRRGWNFEKAIMV